MMQHANSAHVIVRTNARIHMGFFDLNGQTGRRFGSLGLSLDKPRSVIELAVGENVFGSTPLPTYILNSQHLLMQHFKLDVPISVLVHEEIPRHAGLGSGTQMALALGAGISQLLNLDLGLDDVAWATRRGLRSGIGIGTFAQGGVVLDGGRGEQTKIPPILARHDFPSQWRVLLIFDRNHVGVHGEAELRAFKTLQDCALDDTARNAQTILMQALPALVERDLTQFGQAISQLQTYTGGYFAPAQGGMYASMQVTKALEMLKAQGIACVGQTSWGPTGFAVFETEAAAQHHLQQLKQQFGETCLDWLVCQAQNTGASVRVVEA